MHRDSPVIDAAQILPDRARQTPVAIHVVTADDWPKTASALAAAQRTWAKSQGFAARPGQLLLACGHSGSLEAVYLGAPARNDDPFVLGAVAARLPEGDYTFASMPDRAEMVALGWALELYTYDPFRPLTVKPARLIVPKAVDRAAVVRQADASFLVRDLINTPANLLGPAALEAAARQVAKRHGARLKVISGAELSKGFPLIAAVGAASPRAPRLIDFTWGRPGAPKITLVGKGVVFDTGGLDIKPSSSMLLMKKDMGGAANVLGLASLIMAAKLKVRLRVLIPAVENAISGPAFRPGDVFRSRKGLSVEIGNTDAEGRLILADAMALATEEKPDLLVDMATLTGAARVALGPDLPAFFADDEGLAQELQQHASRENDPLWRLPLWRPYESMIESPVADLNNAGTGGYAGAITAALFLGRFAQGAKAHVHLDIFGWTPTAKPGRPKGGEQQGMRALFSLLKARHGH
jgi:leucyl aminopeptidase